MTNTSTDISTTLFGHRFDSLIMNASGPICTTEEELNALGACAAGAIVTKSCTLEARDGNAEPRYTDLPMGAVQCMGLPNLGFNKYIEMLPRLKQHNKPIIASISGLSLADNLHIVEAFQDSDADALEVNFSCPNIAGKPQLAYDFEQMEAALSAICQINNKPLGIKLAPYFDMSHFDSAAQILNRFPIQFVTTINSVGNTLVIDPDSESTLLRPKGGFGGLCGDYVKPVGLANVNALRERLNSSIQIIGVGGIKTGTDVFEYLLAGADAVQIGAFYQQQGPKCFAQLNDQLIARLQKQGYSSAMHAKSKLKIA